MMYRRRHRLGPPILYVAVFRPPGLRLEEDLNRCFHELSRETCRRWEATGVKASSSSATPATHITKPVAARARLASMLGTATAWKRAKAPSTMRIAESRSSRRLRGRARRRRGIQSEQSPAQDGEGCHCHWSCGAES